MFTAADRPGAAKGAHASGTSPCGCFQKQARGLEQYSRELRQASWNWRSLPGNLRASHREMVGTFLILLVQNANQYSWLTVSYMTFFGPYWGPGIFRNSEL